MTKKYTITHVSLIALVTALLIGGATYLVLRSGSMSNYTFPFSAEVVEVSKAYDQPPMNWMENKNQETIKIKFNKDIDKTTLTPNTVFLCYVSLKDETYGFTGFCTDALFRNDHFDDSLSKTFEYDTSRRILTITPDMLSKMGGSTWISELRFTDDLKDMEGNALKGSIYPRPFRLTLDSSVPRVGIQTNEESPFTAEITEVREITDAEIILLAKKQNILHLYKDHNVSDLPTFWSEHFGDSDVIKVQFNKDVFEDTLNENSVLLCGNTGGKRFAEGTIIYPNATKFCEIARIYLDYDEDTRTLTIIPRYSHIGNRVCDTCVHELWLTQEIRDMDGNALNGSAYPDNLLLPLTRERYYVTESVHDDI